MREVWWLSWHIALTIALISFRKDPAEEGTGDQPFRINNNAVATEVLDAPNNVNPYVHTMVVLSVHRVVTGTCRSGEK